MQVLTEGLLKVDPGLLLWTVITFVFLLLILWKTAWKPIVEALDARSEKIRGDIDGAEKARLESEKLLTEHAELMKDAKQQAAGILEKGKEEAEALKNELLENARKDAVSIVEKAKKEIEIAKDTALNDIKEEVVNLSTEIASKVIGRNLNAEDQRVLVEEALSKIETVH